jgi:FdhD protein
MKDGVGTESGGGIVLRYEGGELRPCGHRPVEEHLLALTVNGVELATLVASPHDLSNLVAGFLRMQRLVSVPDDIVSMGICAESGVANAVIRRELPPRLVPTLTSGCGTGIVFDLPPAPGEDARDAGNAGCGAASFAPDEIFSLMEGMASRAEGYRDRGGIHSAAVGEGGRVLLFAEDIGRHNTIDRIAGEALLREIDLSGKMLATSGRVSSEMAAKAAMLGIALIASRTSPTDLAVRLCRERGIALVGYLRGRTFNVYAHPSRLSIPPPSI